MAVGAVVWDSMHRPREDGNCSFTGKLNHAAQILHLLGGVSAWVEVPMLLSWASCLDPLFPQLQRETG